MVILTFFYILSILITLVGSIVGPVLLIVRWCDNPEHPHRERWLSWLILFWLLCWASGLLTLFTYAGAR